MKIIIGAMLATLQITSLQCMIFSLDLWHKESKKVMVVGVCDMQKILEETDESVLQLYEHGRLFKNYIKSISHEPSVKAFFIDIKDMTVDVGMHEKEFISNLLQNIKKIPFLNKKAYWGLFALKHASCYNFLHFAHTDIFVSEILDIPIDFCFTLKRSLREFKTTINVKKLCDSGDPDFLNKEVHAFKLKNIKAFKDTLSLSSIPDVSITDFIDTLNAVEKQLTPVLDNYLFKEYSLLKNTLVEFFKVRSERHKVNNIKMILWKEFKKEKFTSFQDYVRDLIHPFYMLLTLLGIIVNYETVLEDCDYSIIYTGHTKAIKVNNYLQDKNYALYGVWGNQDLMIAEKNKFRPMRIEEIEQALQKAKYNLCACCYKLEGVAQQFKVCGRCKMRYYCSVECQKKAWPKHKQHCVSFEQQT